jgi:ElaB/YqjD/DUF883 family membrane-anchored ribosome-binding protein
MTTNVEPNCEATSARAAVVADFEQIRSAATRLPGDSVNVVREAASGLVAEGRAKVREAQQRVEAKVLEKPVKLVLLAAAAGFLLGVFWRRR